MSKVPTELSKDAKKLLSLSYKEYLVQREQGANKETAMMLSGGAQGIRDRLMPETPVEDVASICWELHDAGYVAAYGANNTVYTATLTNEAIVYMENRLKNGLLDGLELLSKFVP